MSEQPSAILPIRCKCPGCRTPVASWLPDGRLAICARHHGQAHPSTFTLSELIAMRARLEAPTPA